MSYYPYSGFYFKVTFEGLPNGSNDVSFQSVRGLEVQVETETIKEGGVLFNEHVVPIRAKCSPLILERGVFKPENSGIIGWCKKALLEFEFQPITITISLIDENRNPLLSWSLRHAWPKSWKIKDLNAQQGEVLIETLEINYNAFSIKP